MFYRILLLISAPFMIGGYSPFSQSQLKGTLCFAVGACDDKIICLESGYYSIVEDTYDVCEEDDLLVGDFQSYGFIEAYNLTKDTECTMYVNDWETNENSAMEEWKKQCK